MPKPFNTMNAPGKSLGMKIISSVICWAKNLVKVFQFE